MGSKVYFDNVATQWDTMRKGFFSESIREKAFSVVGIESGKVCVDIGAGTGFVTEGIINNGLKVIAVDQSEEMLSQMKAENPPVNPAHAFAANTALRSRAALLSVGKIAGNTGLSITG
jgi:ubiquinone/menaquinone biosynthesis C-methylase UbiE